MPALGAEEGEAAIGGGDGGGGEGEGAGAVGGGAGAAGAAGGFGGGFVVAAGWMVGRFWGKGIFISASLTNFGWMFNSLSKRARFSSKEPPMSPPLNVGFWTPARRPSIALACAMVMMCCPKRTSLTATSVVFVYSRTMPVSFDSFAA